MRGEPWNPSVRDLIDELASRAPTPAAGSAAALSLSQGAALGLKAVRFKRAERNDANARACLAAAEGVLQRVATEAVPKFEEDCRAVRELVAFFKAARNSSSPESRATSTPVEEAMHVPFAVLSLARDGVAAVESIIGIVSKTVICEAGASAGLMWAAAQISYWIVCNNADWLRHEDWSGVVERARVARDSAYQSHEAVRRVTSEIVGSRE